MFKDIHKNAVEKGFYNLDFEINRKLSFNEMLEPKHFKHIERIQDIYKIALMMTELAEAIEGIRNGHSLTPQQLIDFEPHQYKEFIEKHGKSPEVELTDVIIRAGDYLESKGFDVEQLIKLKHNYNKTRPYLHGKEL